MPPFVRINKEQEDHMAVINRIEESISSDLRLLAVDPVIEQARAAVVRAVELDLPLQAYIGLRNYVSMRDNNDRLPEHLRQDFSRREPT